MEQAVGGRPPRYAPAPLLPRERRSVSRGRADGNVAAVSHGQHVPTPTAASAWRANTAVSKAAWWPWPLTFRPWKWYPITRDVDYLCVNFGLPRSLCSRLRPDVRDRQTDRRQTKASLNAPPIKGGGIINVSKGWLQLRSYFDSISTRLQFDGATSIRRPTLRP